MESIIVYGSCYGSAEKYAKELSSRTGICAEPFGTAVIPAECDAVVFIGSLYAGGAKGLKETVSKLKNVRWQKLIVCTVGLSDPDDSTNVANIRKGLAALIPAEWFEKAKVFHLRGGIDYSRLHFFHRVLMKLLYKSVVKIPEEKRTAEEKAMIETYGSKVDFVDFSRLDAVCEAVKE
ncbi:flavodoxin domain-containing protein [uncultured Treponema sp.]|uniref:flavodoxin domain-containing protein n=1 Tax=uncultured Treponema sp. TaxID=162155 RepID=UPI0015BCB4E7|nr:flavodoxin domain-containing protein [uncultured Treponema sp.]